MKFLTLALLLPALASAGELELACGLERSKAEVQATLLAAPELQTRLGRDSTTGQDALTLGVSKSLSGHLRAGTVREAAEAKCDAIRGSLALDSFSRWSMLNAQKIGARAELTKIEEAIALAKADIAQLDAQLTAQTITITQHTEARQTLVNLENREAALLKILAQDSLPTPYVPAAKLIAEAREAEARAAGLTAKAAASVGWDVVFTAGSRKPFDGSSAAGFGTIALTYSFGYEGSKKAASAVAGYTEALSIAAEGGTTQAIVRQRKTLEGYIEAETLNIATTARQRVHLQKVRASIVGIDTALALNTRRALEIQLKVLEADQAGSEVRLAQYQELLKSIL